MRADWLVRVNRQISYLFGSAGSPLGWVSGAKIGQAGCFVLGLSGGLLWLFSSGVLSWFLFPPCDVQTSLESCGRECIVQHRWRCISADIARGCWSLGFFLFTLVCTVLALWRLHCERVQWQVYLKVIRLIQIFD